MTRTFEDHPAKRERVPMLVGLTGPSGVGKTKSSLRLAEGMARVTGGEVFFIDTEARRGLHYADEHKFRHVEMTEPYGALDYLAALTHCTKDKNSIVVVDSMSHEHSGPGGMLDQHDRYLDDKCGDDEKKRMRMTMSGWIKPKRERDILIGAILRLGVNAIFCFRAKEKVKIRPGANPIQLGWQPIAGPEFVFEMLVSILMYPGAEGVPNWNPDEGAEKVMTKIPEHLRGVFPPGEKLSEDTGEALAKWAAGDKAEAPYPESLQIAVSEIRQSLTIPEFNQAMKKWGGQEWSTQDKAELREVATEVKASLTQSDEG